MLRVCCTENGAVCEYYRVLSLDLFVYRFCDNESVLTRCVCWHDLLNMVLNGKESFEIFLLGF